MVLACFLLASFSGGPTFIPSSALLHHLPFFMGFLSSSAEIQGYKYL